MQTHQMLPLGCKKSAVSFYSLLFLHTVIFWGPLTTLHVEAERGSSRSRSVDLWVVISYFFCIYNKRGCRPCAADPRDGPGSHNLSASEGPTRPLAQQGKCLTSLSEPRKNMDFQACLGPGSPPFQACKPKGCSQETNYIIQAFFHALPHQGSADFQNRGKRIVSKLA